MEFLINKKMTSYVLTIIVLILIGILLVGNIFLIWLLKKGRKQKQFKIIHGLIDEDFNKKKNIK